MSEGAKDGEVLSLEDLFANSAGDKSVPFHIDGVGTVLLRSLNRDEALQIAETKSTRAREIKMVSWGMVEPAMTYQQVETWFSQAKFGVIQKLSDQIHVISGMNDKAEAQSVERFRDEPEPGV